MPCQIHTLVDNWEIYMNWHYSIICFGTSLSSGVIVVAIIIEVFSIALDRNKFAVKLVNMCLCRWKRYSAYTQLVQLLEENKTRATITSSTVNTIHRTFPPRDYTGFTDPDNAIISSLCSRSVPWLGDGRSMSLPSNHVFRNCLPYRAILALLN